MEAVLALMGQGGTAGAALATQKAKGNEAEDKKVGNRAAKAASADVAPSMGADVDTALVLVSASDILDQILEGLVAPFSTRVKQVLEVQIATVVVYKVGHREKERHINLGEILGTLAGCFCDTQQGSTGRGPRDFLVV